MSKQYLTAHTLDGLHPTDIFCLAAGPNSLLSASGSSSLKVNSTRSSDFTLTQTLDNVHPLGCHRIVTARSGTRAASIGFGGDLKIWANETLLNADPNTGPPSGAEDSWAEEQGNPLQDYVQDSGVWAIALSADAHYLAATTQSGHVAVWDLTNRTERRKVHAWETKGSFGQCVDIATVEYQDEVIASGHASGAVYVFSLSTGRLLHSLHGLASPVRVVRFSPAASLLAAAGDACVISLYSVVSGEQVASLASGTGPGASAWILGLSWSSATGEYLASANWDGKIRVWRIETRECVATVQEGTGAIWSVEWLKSGGGLQGRAEGFAAGGAGGGVRFYREAAGS